MLDMSGYQSGVQVSYCHHGVEHKHDNRLPVTPPLKWPHNQTICSVPTLSRLSHNVTSPTWKEETEWLGDHVYNKLPDNTITHTCISFLYQTNIF